MTEYDPFLRPKDGSQPAQTPQASHEQSNPPQQFQPETSWPAPAEQADRDAGATPWVATPAPGVQAPATPMYQQGEPYAPGATYAPPQAPQPPVYGAPQGYGAAPASAPTTSGDYDGVSIGALVTGLLSMGPVAVVLGAIGLRRTAGGQRKGTWMAVTGVVLGVLACMVWTAVITAAITATQAYVEPIGSELGDFFDSDQAYGDDADLDALYDQCEAGDNGACNELYWASDFGSEYESFAETCGGREATPMGGYCEE
ncbi:DUF4190 domain-containing protein [Demequina globuliformis]|uniref:DUF4190 domain-containing protein n=1 Tax=Demequina globuliformis TaxID=676202 RepID=UPI0007831A3A|nr:DUF4190 domain-containing protein [Demequina globuliformis]